MKYALFLMLAPLAACATAVYHPTKTEAEMRADVNLCTDTANDKYWFDALAALREAHGCLEAKGYSRANTRLSADVQKASRERQQKPSQPVLPCRVPCR